MHHAPRNETRHGVHGENEGHPKHISTGCVERLNWSVRTSMRRYTRLSNGFSRKIRNHAAAVSLNYFVYNFVRIYRTLNPGAHLSCRTPHGRRTADNDRA